MPISSVDWSALDWQPVRPGVSRKVFTGEGATLALHRLEPGHEPNPHSHPHEQIVYILQGRARFYVGEEETVLGPGGLIVIPPDVRHYAEVVGDEDVLNLDIFTPKRPEYVG